MNGLKSRLSREQVTIASFEDCVLVRRQRAQENHDEDGLSEREMEGLTASGR
jgi:hypothetical protein